MEEKEYKRYERTQKMLSNINSDYSIEHNKIDSNISLSHNKNNNNNTNNYNQNYNLNYPTYEDKNQSKKYISTGNRNIQLNNNIDNNGFDERQHNQSEFLSAQNNSLEHFRRNKVKPIKYLLILFCYPFD